MIPVGAMLAWACFVRGGDKTFDNTLSQSVRELLYIPVSADVKYKAKIFIDMFVSKFATGLGAALFLVLYCTSGSSTTAPTSRWPSSARSASSPSSSWPSGSS